MSRLRAEVAAAQEAKRKAAVSEGDHTPPQF